MINRLDEFLSGAWTWTWHQTSLIILGPSNIDYTWLTEATIAHVSISGDLSLNFNQVFVIAGGKTRTQDKYRVVYTDHQRLELEKEFQYNKYITMRRKSELSVGLSLSERQVRINENAQNRSKLKQGKLETWTAIRLL